VSEAVAEQTLRVSIQPQPARLGDLDHLPPRSDPRTGLLGEQRA
jgi:hypothetical protein